MTSREQPRDTPSQRRVAGRAVSAATSIATSISEQGDGEEETHVDENGKKVRTQNFNKWELITLCKSYANCTSDPRVGNGQKGHVFWSKVAEKYTQIHSVTDYCVRRRFNSRSAEQLSNKFKMITKHMVLFNKHYRQLHSEKPSGVPEEQYIDLVIDRFKEHEGVAFKFKECVPILHDIVKFRPFETNREDDSGIPATPSDNGRTNMTGVVMGSGMSRPPGRNRAKEDEAARRLEERNARRGVTTTPVVPPTSNPVSLAALACDRMTKAVESSTAANVRMDSFLMRSQVFQSLMLLGRKEEANSILSLDMIPIMKSTVAAEAQVVTGEEGQVALPEQQQELLEIEDNEQIDFAPDCQENPPGNQGEDVDVQSVGSSTVVPTPGVNNNRQKRLLEEPEMNEEEKQGDTQQDNRNDNRSVNLLESSSSEEDDDSYLKYAGHRRKVAKKYNHPPDEYDHRDTQALRAALHLRAPIDYGTQALMGEASEFTTFISPDKQVEVSTVPGALGPRLANLLNRST